MCSSLWSKWENRGGLLGQTGKKFGGVDVGARLLLSHSLWRFGVFREPVQLELPFDLGPKTSTVAAEKHPGFRVIQGGGQKRHETLSSRDAVVRVLVEAGADVLLRRISHERAELIQDEVDKVLALFDKVDANPLLMPVLEKSLTELENLMTETRQLRRHSQRSGR